VIAEEVLVARVGSFAATPGDAPKGRKEPAPAAQTAARASNSSGFLSLAASAEDISALRKSPGGASERNPDELEARAAVLEQQGRLFRALGASSPAWPRTDPTRATNTLPRSPLLSSAHPAQTVTLLPRDQWMAARRSRYRWSIWLDSGG